MTWLTTNWPEAILLTCISIAGVYWLVMLHCAFRMLMVPRLDRLNPAEPAEWPELSVIVPACNEADQIGGALKSLLDQDYPNLQIIAVDDRSTDETGRIIDATASQDSRLKAIHVAELPEGWLGKIHAMKQGLDASTGGYVLFTDADVHFKPGVLRKAVAHILHSNLDHLAALPGVWPTGVVLDSIIMIFMRLLLVFTRPWKVFSRNSSAFFGVGAFNMVRREALDATEGLEWLKMETADDMALGMMMKKSGARCGMMLAMKDIGLWWYKTVGEAMRGAEKGYSLKTRYSLLRVLPPSLLILICELAPLFLPLAFFLPVAPSVCWAGLAVSGLYLTSILTLACLSPQNLAPKILSPLGSFFIVFGCVRAAILGKRRGGAYWRGVLYPEQALRDGKRLRM